MARCDWCKQEMDSLETTTCTWNTHVEFPDGEKMPSVPYSDHEAKRCAYCNVGPGGFHHPGCDKERCPKCFGQLISCGCLD